MHTLRISSISVVAAASFASDASRRCRSLFSQLSRTIIDCRLCCAYSLRCVGR